MKQLSGFSIDWDRWCTGLFEAEGWISPQAKAKSGVQIALRMANFPVVRAVHRIMGVGNLYIAKKVPPINHQLQWSVTRYEEQIEVLGKLLREGLFSRRSLRIMELLAWPDMSTPDIDMSWLGGYMTGEASFIRQKSGPIVSIQVRDDVDVLDAVSAYFNAGSVITSLSDPGMYRWRVCGDNARKVMMEVYPYVDFRKRFDIERAQRLDNKDWSLV